MRWAPLVMLLVLPGASAASQLHLTFTGDAYALGFVADAANGTSLVTSTGAVAPTSAGGGWSRARLPLEAGWYEIDGVRHELPPPPARNATTRIVFVGDLGVEGDAREVVAAMERADPDLVLIGGDLSYAHGDEAVWRAWFDLMEPLAARVPMMPAFGNHEAYCEEEDGGFVYCDEERARWPQLFALPNDPALYYAFDWGPARIVSLDSEAYVGPDGHPTEPEEQHAFLNASLEDEERWRIVMFHRPLRTTSARENAALEEQREALEPLLLGRADLVLQAHVHAYERAKPEDGTLLVTSGGGGRELYDAWGAEAPWLAKRAAEHHFLVLDVSPTRIDGKALRPDGSTLDSFALERAAPPEPTPAPASPTGPAGTTPTTPGSPGSAAAPTPEEALTPFPLLAALALVLVTAWSRRRAPPSP